MKFLNCLLFMFLRRVVCFTYTDQKQNCTVHVTDTYCYNGPRFDAIGQYKSCSVPGTIALTFDDGVDLNVPYVLKTLALFNFKATFFTIGQNIQFYPWMVQDIVNQGHQIGWHSYSHPWFSNLTLEQARQEFFDFENAFLQNNYHGVLSNRKVPSYGRFPHGLLPPFVVPLLKNFTITPIQWSFLNGDTYITDYTEIVPLFKSHLYNAIGSTLSIIIQQHDVQQVTVQSLYDVLYYLNSTFPNTRFVTVAECLGNTIPMYHESRFHQEDPTCSTGIKKAQNGRTVCCLASCSTGNTGCTGENCCGGTGCSLRPGHSAGCCSNNIIAKNISCAYSRPPCLVE